MTRADMDRVRDEFVRSAEMAERAGFDWLELHYAHGYLMSSFITPLTNKRTDEYGGSLENRMRFPLEVFRAVRKVWPDEQADLGAHLGATTGSAPTASRRRTRSRSRACWRRTASTSSTSPPGRPRSTRAAGLRPHVPDAVLRPHPQRGRHRHARGRQHLRARPRQFDPDGRPRRSGLPRRGRISPIPTGRCMRRPSSATRARPGRSPIWRGRDQLYRLKARAETMYGEGVMGALTGRHALDHRRRQRHRRRHRAAPCAAQARRSSLAGRREAPLEEVAGDCRARR